MCPFGTAWHQIAKADNAVIIRSEVFLKVKACEKHENVCAGFPSKCAHFLIPGEKVFSSCAVDATYCGQNKSNNKSGSCCSHSLGSATKIQNACKNRRPCVLASWENVHTSSSPARKFFPLVLSTRRYADNKKSNNKSGECCSHSLGSVTTI